MSEREIQEIKLESWLYIIDFCPTIGSDIYWSQDWDHTDDKRWGPMTDIGEDKKYPKILGMSTDTSRVEL